MAAIFNPPGFGSRKSATPPDCWKTFSWFGQIPPLPVWQRVKNLGK